MILARLFGGIVHQDVQLAQCGDGLLHHITTERFQADISGALGFVRHQDPAHKYVVTRGELLDDICVLMGGRGIGFLVSGPLSGALLDMGTRAVQAGGRGDVNVGIWAAYSSRYGPIIICTGASAVLGAWGWLWNLGKPSRRIWESMWGYVTKIS